ncbi:MAG: N-acetylglucosamine-6-phosphate deacetylase, partial [Candidatus Hydrogenedentes bacterium]|nr:N-acetylglucosamine-6-phosphate deacetylase [Candidatus Hydrogenedentota bacterium]
TTLIVDDVRQLTHCMAVHGVGYWIPTLITGPIEVMERTCRVIVEARRSPAVRRAIPCIHVEGPFISPQDGARGAHAKDFVRKPNLHEFERLQEAAKGAIRYITLAPEWDGAPGVVVALGHHNASEEHIAAAVEAGARLCTHLGNGLASMIHRHFNPLWPQLAEDRLAAGFIADLEHLPAPVLKSFVRVKGPERTILTSDCVHIAGLKPGRYSLGGMAVELLPTGRIRLSGTDLLAGSSLMLLQGVVNAARATDLTLEQAVGCATSVPAKVLRVPLHFKRPRAGEKAEFIVFDIEKDADRWRAILHGVFIDGKFFDRKETT